MAERESLLMEEQNFDAWNFDGDPGQGGFRTDRVLDGHDDVVDLAAVEDSFSLGASSSSPRTSGDSRDGDNGAGDDYNGLGPASGLRGAVEQTIKVEGESPHRKERSGVKSKEEKKNRPSWRYMSDKVKMSVQIPPAGPFTRADLQWETKCNQGRGRRRETHKATIPWDRLDDFLEGEMSARQHPCTFVEETRKCKKKGERKQVRAESAVQEIRSCIPDPSLSYIVFLPCPCLISICNCPHVCAM